MARELGDDVPERPLLFLKPPSSLLRNGEPIVLPADSERVEHEGEIGIVIGRRARHVTEAEALAVVAGYAPLNHVTARDLQRLDVHSRAPRASIRSVRSAPWPTGRRTGVSSRWFAV